MSIVEANRHRFDVQAIVLDKDGTLIDIHHLWGNRTSHWVREMVSQANGNTALSQEFYKALGANSHTGRLAPDGPSAVGTSAMVGALAAGVLYQNGWPWHEAETLVKVSAQRTIFSPLTAGELRPMGDVAEAVARLADAGLLLAVATGDDRAMTEETLVQLGIDRYISVLLCGDDPLPHKPDPGALEWVAGKLGVSPAEMLMVGDTATDMLAGRNAGVAGCVGIHGGAGDPALLARLADVVVGSIDELHVIDEAEQLP